MNKRQKKKLLKKARVSFSALTWRELQWLQGTISRIRMDVSPNIFLWCDRRPNE